MELIDRWNERHRAGGGEFTPDELVMSTAHHLPPGRALDLACGTGRNALWLASQGWQVTAVDASHVAIEILKAKNVSIDARIADLERCEFAIEPESWELILICRYLQRDLFDPAKAGVVPGGILIATALVSDEERRFRLRRGELPKFFADWEILHNREESLAEIVARKRDTAVKL